MDCLWLHNWAAWEFVEAGELQEGGKKIGWVLLQKRCCLRCGYTQLEAQTKYA